MHKYVYEVLEDQQKKTSTASAMFLKGRPFCSDYTLFDFHVIAFQFSCFFFWHFFYRLISPIVRWLEI